jgi:3-deoxy-D-manno-octulosonic-acid transferase
MSLVLYRIAVSAYHLLIRIASIRNKKARKWLEGRKSINWNEISFARDKVIWMHCASLGEFEQGKLVFETFLAHHPDWKSVITFFSPSGYEHLKDYEQADLICYLPAETKKNVQRWMQHVQPDISLMVKYEYWFGYLDALVRSKSKVIYMASVFRPDNWFFKYGGKEIRRILKAIDKFYVQEENSERILRSFGIDNVEVSGDTRFDRVMKTATDTLDIDWLNQFKSDSNLIIIGSLRPADLPLLELLLQADLTGYKVLIAPHDMDDKIIEVVSKYKENIVRYTSMVTGELENANIFILDTMGWLSRSYKYADIAYVGGGFDDSIHNILEPAVFGIPVFFGPRHKKNPEALELLDLIPDLSSTDYNEILKSIEKRISDEELRKKEGDEIKSWIMRNSGATPIILKGLNKIASAISSQTF